MIPDEAIVAATAAARLTGRVLLPDSGEESRQLEQAIRRYIDGTGQPLEDAAYGRVQNAHAAVEGPPVHPGMIVATPGVDAIAKADPDSVMPEIQRIVMEHIKLSDAAQEKLDPEDRAENLSAAKNGRRTLTRWKLGEADIYVITEWDRSKTTILLVEEY